MILFKRPEDTGGCPIENFTINYSLPGSMILDQTVAKQKNENSHSFTYTPSDMGKSIYYQIEAFNEVGSTKTEIISILLATLPPKPNAPASSLSETSTSHYTINYNLISKSLLSGGSDIISYEVQIKSSDSDTFEKTIGSLVSNDYNTSSQVTFFSDKSFQLRRAKFILLN
jgi:hypothetical protein